MGRLASCVATAAWIGETSLWTVSPMALDSQRCGCWAQVHELSRRHPVFIGDAWSSRAAVPGNVRPGRQGVLRLARVSTRPVLRHLLRQESHADRHAHPARCPVAARRGSLRRSPSVRRTVLILTTPVSLCTSYAGEPCDRAVAVRRRSISGGRETCIPQSGSV